MKYRYLFSLVCLLCCFCLLGQPLSSDFLTNRVWEQTVQFPQEKLYLHVDKPTYAIGEKVWLRVYVVNALTLHPELVSRYVYVELVNPFNDVIDRVRLRQDTKGYIYVHMSLSDSLPSGTYSIRAYTRYMENLDTEYFFSKKLQVVSPLSKNIRITPVQIAKDKLEFHFTHPVTGNPVNVFTTSVFTEAGKLEHRQYRDRISATVHSDKLRNKVVLVQAGNYKEFVALPGEKTFSVSFLPEGGSLLNGILCEVAFKALNQSGLGETVKGKIIDDKDSLITTFHTIHTGMGRVSFIPVFGRKYRAVCQNTSGIKQVFNLPSVLRHCYALKLERHKGNMICHIQNSLDIVDNDSLYLLVHQSGLPKYVGLCTNEHRSLFFESSVFFQASSISYY